LGYSRPSCDGYFWFAVSVGFFFFLSLRQPFVLVDSSSLKSLHQGFLDVVQLPLSDVFYSFFISLLVDLPFLPFPLFRGARLTGVVERRVVRFPVPFCRVPVLFHPLVVTCLAFFPPFSLRFFLIWDAFPSSCFCLFPFNAPSPSYATPPSTSSLFPRVPPAPPVFLAFVLILCSFFRACSLLLVSVLDHGCLDRHVPRVIFSAL